MKINRPYIKTSEEFLNYIKIFDNYSEIYNTNKELKYKLRSTHRQLYFTLIHLYRKMLFNHNNVLKDEPELCFIESAEPPSLYTNRRELGLRLKINGSTIYRQLLRLIDAGIILEKKFHGVEKSFELLINPEFLLIYDKKQQNYIPSSKFLETKKSNIQNDSSAICTCFGLYPQHDNIISTVDNSYSEINNLELIQNKLKCLSKKFKNYPNKQSKTLPKHFIQNTEKQVRISELNKKNNNKNALNETKSSFKRWFYQYLIAMLFSDKNIFPAELEKSMQYIFNNYFVNCLTIKDCENFKKQLKWRVDAAKRYITRNNFDFSNIYPAKYINLDNKKSGFINTQKWWADSVKYQNDKQKANPENKIKLSDYKKLNQQVGSLRKNYTVDNYRKAEKYVKKNIPNLKTEFYNRMIV